MTDGGQVHAGTVRVWLCLLCGSKTVEKGKGNSPHLLDIDFIISVHYCYSIVQFIEQQ